MSKKIISIAVVIILLVLVVGSYVAYQNKTPQVQQSTYVNTGSTDILTAPKSDAPQVQRQEYYSNVAQSAVATNTVAINACMPTPQTISVKEGSTVTFVNKDAQSHSIVFSSGYSVNVRATSSVSMKADFKGKPGIYPYGCDTSKTKAGIVLITK